MHDCAVMERIRRESSCRLADAEQILQHHWRLQSDRALLIQSKAKDSYVPGQLKRGMNSATWLDFLLNVFGAV